MDERIKQLLDDLEQYIRDNWVAPEDAGPSESLALTEEEISLPGDQDSEDTSGTSGVSSTSGADGISSKSNAPSTPSKSGVLFSEDKSSLSLEDLIVEV